jgi:RNA polymerase subunit RPABC4/transcription elongation factor Spt4
MEWLLLWLGRAIAAGVIAGAKGRSGFGYFILALLLPLIGVLIAIGMPSAKPTTVIVKEPKAGDLIACHACGGPRTAASTRCPHCKAPKFDPAADMKKCPACAELIKKDAKKCRYCGEAV